MSAELERLRDRVAELEEAMGLTAKFPPNFFAVEAGAKSRCPSPMVRKIIGILVARPFVDKDALWSVLYGSMHEVDQPEPKTVEVHLSFARKALALHGIIIRNAYKTGWYLGSADRAKLRALLVERAEAA